MDVRPFEHPHSRAYANVEAGTISLESDLAQVRKHPKTTILTVLTLASPPPASTVRSYRDEGLMVATTEQELHDSVLLLGASVPCKVTVVDYFSVLHAYLGEASLAFLPQNANTHKK